jgi:hypothetical protein
MDFSEINVRRREFEDKAKKAGPAESPVRLS